MSNTNEKTLARIETFSDGVFAIAITLLILELRVPKPAELGSESLAQALLTDWPSYFAFLLSFFTILIMWFNHHRLFTHIRRADHMLSYVNGFLLLFICVTPWPTALMAEYLGQPNERTAIIVFAGFFVMLAIAYNLLWRYASYKAACSGPMSIWTRSTASRGPTGPGRSVTVSGSFCRSSAPPPA